MQFVHAHLQSLGHAVHGLHLGPPLAAQDPGDAALADARPPGEFRIRNPLQLIRHLGHQKTVAWVLPIGQEGGILKPLRVTLRRSKMSPEQQKEARRYARSYYAGHLDEIRSQQRAKYARQVGHPVRPSSNMRAPSPIVPFEEETLP